MLNILQVQLTLVILLVIKFRFAVVILFKFIRLFAGLTQAVWGLGTYHAKLVWLACEYLNYSLFLNRLFGNFAAIEIVVSLNLILLINTSERPIFRIRPLVISRSNLLKIEKWSLYASATHHQISTHIFAAVLGEMFRHFWPNHWIYPIYHHIDLAAKVLRVYEAGDWHVLILFEFEFTLVRNHAGALVAAPVVWLLLANLTVVALTFWSALESDPFDDVLFARPNFRVIVVIQHLLIWIYFDFFLFLLILFFQFIKHIFFKIYFFWLLP